MMKYLDYRKRLGIGFDNSQLESLFLNKMKNHLEVTRANASFANLVTPRMVFLSIVILLVLSMRIWIHPIA